jgi:hypothetical protein
MAGVTRVIAVAATAAFAGGALLSQTVVVPAWRAMAPAAFLRDFAVSGPVTGATVFPFEALSVVLLVAVAVRGRRPLWMLAALCMVGSVVLLPVYFVPANAAMLDPAFPVHAVRAELAGWYRWNWGRTGCGLAAAVLAVAALARDVHRRRHATGAEGAPDSLVWPRAGVSTREPAGPRRKGSHG